MNTATQRTFTACAAALLLTSSAALHAADSPLPATAKVETVVPRKIWDVSRITDLKPSRVELTDLCRFQGHWYCGFREGEIHMNHPSGRARVIRSTDGRQWESVALFRWDGADVREPRFSITAEGRLMANTSLAFVSPKPDSSGKHSLITQGALGPDGHSLANPDGDLEASVSRQSVTWLTSDGLAWSEANACPTGVNTWRWDVSWHRGMGYSVGYSGKDMAGTLYRTRDGKSWRPLLDRFFPEGLGNEASIAFTADDSACCLLRDGPGSKMLGIGKPPYYLQWMWKDTRADWEGDGRLKPAKEVIRSLGGPKLKRLSDGRLLGVARCGGISLFWVDPQNAILTRFAIVQGSTYGGFVEHDGALWVSCGDSTASGIYLAEVKLPAPAEK